MNDFNKLCNIFEEMDELSYAALLAEKSVKIIPALAEITEDGIDGVSLFATFVLGAVAADGKLSEEEFAICLPLFVAFFGENVNFEDCKDLVKKSGMGKDLKKYVDGMVDLLGLLSEDLKDDIILVCMMICAIDGKISLKEKLWIKQLIR